jgi:hypothetical protein
MSLADTIFMHGDELAIMICQAWKYTEDPEELAEIIKRPPTEIEAEISRLKKVGLLLDDKKISHDAELYINTYMAAEISSIKGEGGRKK